MKTLKQLKEIFTELTGRDATSYSVRSEFELMGWVSELENIYLDNLTARKKEWWQRVIDVIWDKIESTQCNNVAKQSEVLSKKLIKKD